MKLDDIQVRTMTVYLERMNAQMANAATAVPADQQRTYRDVFNGHAPATMAAMFPAPAFSQADRLNFGKRGEYEVMLKPRDIAGTWANKLTGVSGRYFSELIAALFNEDESKALARLVGWEQGHGKHSDQNRLKVILKHELDNEWQSRWERGQPVPSGKMCKTIRSYWGTDLSFAGDTSHALRSGDSDNKLMALHRDALTDCPVGLSVRATSLSPDISFGDLTAPIKLHEHRKIEQQLFLARDLRTGLAMLQSHSPLWVVQDYAKVELPKHVMVVGMATDRTPGDYALIKHLKPIYASRGVTIRAIEPENGERWAA